MHTFLFKKYWKTVFFKSQQKQTHTRRIHSTINRITTINNIRDNTPIAIH